MSVLLFDNANVASKNDKKIKEENIGRRIPNQLIQEFLSEYSLNQTRGLGLVVFIAEINKQNESTLLQFVFFEINSRDIISVDNYYLPGATGVGMGNHWKFNFSFSVIKFLNDYNLDLYFDYRSEYKRKKKRMKKLKQ